MSEESKIVAIGDLYLKHMTFKEGDDVDLVGLSHCAPEYFKENEWGKPSDIWALGVLLYEMWTGKLPFLKKNVLQIKRRIV